MRENLKSGETKHIKFRKQALNSLITGYEEMKP